MLIIVIRKIGDDGGRVPGGRKRLPVWKTEKQERTEWINELGV